MTISYSALNMRYSVDRLLRGFLSATSGVTFYRFAPPATPQEQVALIADRALFVAMTPEFPNRWTNINATLYLADKWDKAKYTPAVPPDLWLQDTATRLMTYLNTGDAARAHWFPFYDFENAIPPAVLQTFRSSGNATPLAVYWELDAPKVQDVGIAVSGGHSRPTINIKQNPLLWETAVTFFFHAPDVWSDQRGS